jgi:hypothetical protein
MRTVIDRYSFMDEVYEGVKKSGVAKFVNLNERYSPLKPATPALAAWLNKYPCCDYYEDVRPQRTSHNARKYVIV